MGVYLVILFIALAILTVLSLGLLLPLRFRFWGVVAPGDVRYRAEIRLPLMPWYMALPDIRRKSKKPPEAEPREQRSALDSLQKALSAFRQYYPEVAKTASNLARTVRVDRFRLSARLGTGDAYDTALLVGGTNAVVGVLLSVAQKKGIEFTERPRVNVVPVYDGMYAAAEFRLATSITPWRGIVAAFRLYRQVKSMQRAAAPVVSNARAWNTRA